MPYSGNLVRNQGRDARTLPAPDPAHGVLDANDPNAGKWVAPPGNAYPTGSSEFPTVVMNNPGLTLSTPTGSHDSPARLGAYPDDTSWAQDITGAHDGRVDHGYLESNGNYYPGALQDSLTSYQGDVIQLFGSPAPAPVVLQRGRNSNAVNNPPVEGYDEGGFRHGLFRWRSVWRQRLQNTTRDYDVQPVYERSIQTIENSPVPAQAPYWAPYADSMARAVTRTQMTPALARQPVDMAAGDTALAPDYGTAAGSVIGGGTW
jgi:hypothetical protein